MLFNRPEFFVLLAITWFIYYLPKFQKYQVNLLIISSLVFYSYTYPLLVLLLLSSMLINTYCSYQVAKASFVRQRLWAVYGVTLNLLILSFFKYSPLLARTFHLNGSGVGDFLLAIPLPIGISFFTFQGISLVVDVFQRKNNHQPIQDMIPEKFIDHLKHTFLFVAFFPQLVAGPIVKGYEFMPQIRPKTWVDIDRRAVFKALVVGYFLKVVIADQLKNHTYWIAYPFFMDSSSVDLLGMLFGYSMQIFADFAGYSLIAIGIAGLFGYQLKDNFMFPYIATSFSEFWRRWHISLSSFLKEYLYFPLGGNRKGKLRTYLNLMIVMFLGGLWHGAAWSYAVWGTVHGVALAIERLFNDWVSLKKTLLLRFLQGILVFSVVTFAWLLFKLPNFSEAILYVKAIWQNTQKIPNYHRLFYVLVYSFPVIVYHMYYLFKQRNPDNILTRLEPYVYGAMIFMILTNSGTSGDFIYFQF